MEGKRGSECLLKSVSNIDFNPLCIKKETSLGLFFIIFSLFYSVEHMDNEVCENDHHEVFQI